MTVVEAIASGKPVIALGRGGVLESASNGFFFDTPESEKLRDAIEQFERMESQIDPQALRQSAQRFAPQVFDARMKEILERDLK